MKHIKKAEQKLSDTKGFIWIFAVLRLIPEATKATLLFLWDNATIVVMAATLVGMVGVYRAVDVGALGYTSALLFVGILVALFLAMIKIRILEHKENDR